MKWLLLGITIAFSALIAATPGQAAHTLPNSCALSPIPDTYEALQDRAVYLQGEELAGYNMIAPADPFFGTPIEETGPRSNRSVAADPYIPPTLLKAIGAIESNIAQADHSVFWGAVGPTKVSFDCGHGIMQITSGMTGPADGGWPSGQQALIATHYLYNIARGAAILVNKWNAAPEFRPVVGDGDPAITENWYFAVWSYNGFTGPGAFISNHPLDPQYDAWPRTGFSCGPLNDGFGHSFADYPYQEIVFGCVNRPLRVGGAPLWEPQQLALPDLNDPAWSGPLSLGNFAFPYANMDIPTMCQPTGSAQAQGAGPTPTPTPTPPPPVCELDAVSQPHWVVPALLRGAPQLAVSHTQVTEDVTQVTISNTGQSPFGSILAWRAKPDQPWISVDKQAGVALEPGIPCTDGFPCPRSATLTISVNTALAPGSGKGTVTIESLITGEQRVVSVVRGQAPPPDPDTDNDGCTNEQELGPDETLGGRRDPDNFWDFFDVPTGPDFVRDGTISTLDVFAVLARFGATGDPTIDPLALPPATGYHTAYDRGSAVGPNAWNLGPADGAITVGDIFALLAQFGHTCT